MTLYKSTSARFVAAIAAGAQVHALWMLSGHTTQTKNSQSGASEQNVEAINDRKLAEIATHTVSDGAGQGQSTDQAATSEQGAVPEDWEYFWPGEDGKLAPVDEAKFTESAGAVIRKHAKHIFDASVDPKRLTITPLGKGEYGMAFLVKADGKPCRVVKFPLKEASRREMEKEHKINEEIFDAMEKSTSVPVEEKNFFREHIQRVRKMEVGGIPILISDFGGQSLEQLIQSGASKELTFSNVIAIFHQLAKIIHLIHELGYALVDLHEGNVLVDTESSLPKVTLIDFGECSKSRRGSYEWKDALKKDSQRCFGQMIAKFIEIVGLEEWRSSGSRTEKPLIQKTVNKRFGHESQSNQDKLSEVIMSSWVDGKPMCQPDGAGVFDLMHQLV